MELGHHKIYLERDLLPSFLDQCPIVAHERDFWSQTAMLPTAACLGAAMTHFGGEKWLQAPRYSSS